MLITTSKKAVTEDDAQRILDESYSFCEQHSPYDVPVLILRPEEFADCVDGTPIDYGNVQSLYAQRLSVFLKSHNLSDTSMLRSLTNGRQINPVTVNLVNANRDKDVMYSGIFSSASGNGKLQAPFAVIQAPKATMTAKDRLAYMLDMEVANLASSYPGAPAHWQFLDLWHEIGHATGAGEPQTDKMAAILARKAFADASFLQMEADIRYAKAVLYSHDKYIVNEYGWGMGDAIEDVLAMPEQAITDITSSEIKNMRADAYNSFSSDVRHVGRMLRAEIGKKHFVADHLPDIARTTTSLLRKGVFGEAASKRYEIASRFALAAERLSQGNDAYKASIVTPSP